MKMSKYQEDETTVEVGINNFNFNNLESADYITANAKEVSAFLTKFVTELANKSFCISMGAFSSEVITKFIVHENIYDIWLCWNGNTIQLNKAEIVGAFYFDGYVKVLMQNYTIVIDCI